MEGQARESVVGTPAAHANITPIRRIWAITAGAETRQAALPTGPLGQARGRDGCPSRPQWFGVHWTNHGIHRIHGKSVQGEGTFLSPHRPFEIRTGTRMSPLL